MLISHPYRVFVLGLMFFLAGTAFCSCDAYDPDPYDDVPPLVVVEFNYLLPGGVSIQAPHAVALRLNTGVATGFREYQAQPAGGLSTPHDQQLVSTLPPGTPLFLPLRR